MFRAFFVLLLASTAIFLAVCGFAENSVGERPLAKTTVTNGSALGSWSIVPSPNTGDTQYNTLYGVTCPSASDCWAVGYYSAAGTHSQTLIEHWDGNSWRIVNSANTSSAESNFLLAVTCTSSTDCWAVGHHDSGAVAIFNTLIEHYDGVSWSVVDSPNSLGGQDNELQAVTCTSSTDCWAVGYYSFGNPALPGGALVYQTLIEHWNGTSWTIVTSPNSSPVENNNLHGVSCSSAVDCWAVGFSSSSVKGTLTLTEHYDGTAWSILSSPNPSPANNNVPLGVACLSDTDCWLAGYYSETNVTQSLVEHYDGASWNVVNSANTSSTQTNFPFAITCPSSTECWVVGYYFAFPGSDVLTLIEHYDGTSWSVINSPNPPPNLSGQHTDFLTAVTCSSTTDCWAVGYYFNVNGVQQTVIEHYTLPVLNVSAITRLTNGHIMISGQADRLSSVNIQASPDLIQSFATIGSTTADATGAFQFEDTNAANFTKRFYRASYP